MTRIIKLFNQVQGCQDWEPDPSQSFPMEIVAFLNKNTENQCTMARLNPGKALPLHYHRQGGDIFLVLQGQGRLTTGRIGNESEGEQDKAESLEEQDLETGDLYSIEPYEIHGIENTGPTDLVWLNIAPASHGGDDCIELGSN
ncbi:cupin domain-containing protein [Cyanobium sp. HWJ4-Hawea]|uniref:cupin domain-containing protein n=1 Tax=unclassified Cyanobium TaxID=2627006 RepID=UPI0020CBAD13|nr:MULTISPECIES: cupin domain-containing protein [unclassified Cyanobium]MCP9774877.1 cupin domain-containing protein [Cyanobium sp. WAJ14-Wanaka]MCP9808968.1 cupin domain-containing protein [Cyanobium sp. HWJ4-Hawea]